MKIVFAGGGTGGHFYPLIAVAEEVRAIIEQEKLIGADLYFMAPDPINERILFENGIKFVRTRAGKLRRYFSIKNFFDVFVTGWGIVGAIWKLYIIFPDVIFSKGGYGAFPTLWAARILRIPVIIHESDSHPGRVSLWSSKFAYKIAVSYPEAVKYFPPDKTAITGNPIRRELLSPLSHGAHEYLKLETDKPVIFVVGGSLGSTQINEAVLAILPKLIEHYQVVHQVGATNYPDLLGRTSLVLKDNPNANHYKIFDYLNSTALRMVAGIANLVVTRAGSMLFEIAYWGIPALVIPIPEEVSHDQRINALTYAQSGGAIVIEEKNMTPSVLLSEIDRLMGQPALLEQMKVKAKAFAKPNAGEVIARELIAIALSHEQ